MTDFERPDITRRLGDIPMSSAIVEEMEETGVIDARFRSEPAASELPALDGSLATLFVGASGLVTRLRIEDHVDHETDRSIDFEIGTVRLVWLGDVIRVTLRAFFEPTR
jgi:hypothetical protein